MVGIDGPTGPRRQGGEKGLEEHRGQAEVIGTVLMVGIVVIIAATVGTLIFGLDIVQDGERAVAPQVTFEATADNGNVTIEHRSGDTLDMEEITVLVDGEEFDEDLPEDRWTSGQSVTIEVDPGDTIRIVWNDADGDESDVIYRYTHD